MKNRRVNPQAIYIGSFKRKLEIKNLFPESNEIKVIFI